MIEDIIEDHIDAMSAHLNKIKNKKHLTYMKGLKALAIEKPRETVIENFYMECKSLLSRYSELDFSKGLEKYMNFVISEDREKYSIIIGKSIAELREEKENVNVVFKEFFQILISCSIITDIPYETIN